MKKLPSPIFFFLILKLCQRIGGLAVAVPGEIRGYWDAHQAYGVLPWRDLFQPAIDMCESGSTVQPPLGRVLKQQRDKILAEPSLR